MVRSITDFFTLIKKMAILLIKIDKGKNFYVINFYTIFTCDLSGYYYIRGWVLSLL
jgi:hypothetical protein